MFETSASMSVLMKFRIHEKFQSNIHPWNMSEDYLCELCIVSRRQREVGENNWEKRSQALNWNLTFNYLMLYQL